MVLRLMELCLWLGCVQECRSAIADAFADNMPFHRCLVTFVFEVDGALLAVGLCPRVQ